MLTISTWWCLSSSSHCWLLCPKPATRKKCPSAFLCAITKAMRYARKVKWLCCDEQPTTNNEMNTNIQRTKKKKRNVSIKLGYIVCAYEVLRDRLTRRSVGWRCSCLLLDGRDWTKSQRPFLSIRVYDIWATTATAASVGKLAEMRWRGKYE